MAKVILQGETLGQKHRQYNKLVKDVVQNESTLKYDDINYQDFDVDNLMKIDIASHQKNVQFILKVLKSEDLLYVSRAMKQCTWLITDPQYANIINPEYLHSKLFPEMTTKAVNKFIFNIRLNLKDSLRVEEFYKYYQKINRKDALKWLPHCSLTFIEQEVGKQSAIISSNLLKRLCEKSITILEIYNSCKSCNTRNCNKKSVYQQSIFLLKTDTEKYLNMLEKMPVNWRSVATLPTFNKKTTKLVMKKCPERIIKNFNKYMYSIHMPTFAKYMKKEDIKDFLINLAKEDDRCITHWLKVKNIKPLIERIPNEERFKFVKDVFIDKAHSIKDECIATNPVQFALKTLCDTVTENDYWMLNEYYWYQFATFPVAFEELKKSIASESSPEKRKIILEILTICAGDDLQHTKTLLQYYNEKHVKDQSQMKNEFIVNVLSHKNVNKFDKTIWNYLETIFESIDVYKESENTQSDIIDSIVTYKVINDEQVPEVIEKKFSFNPLQAFYPTLTKDQKEKVFSYLYNSIVKTLNNQKTSNQEEFTTTIQLTQNAFDLLKVWNRDLPDFPFIVNKVKELTKLKKENSWKESLSCLYSTKKTWRKYLFEESLILNPSGETCINALKHDSTILSRYKSEVDIIRFNNSKSLLELVSKLRIYWPQSLAIEWIENYNENLCNINSHKAITRALCVILPNQKLLKMILKYAPKEPKINWNEVDEMVLSLQRHFAKNMYLARPQLPPDAILNYTKGDYLQYSLPSLHAIFYNLSYDHGRKHIPKLWDAPVSLQKHGIRFAFMKMKTEELKDAFSNIWKTSKNSTIRAVIFELTFKLLCREKNEEKINAIWELMEVFIDNLKSDEDKKIYELLSEVDKVPIIVRAKYLVKNYTFLKNLLNKVKTGELKIGENNYDNNIRYLAQHTREVMETVDAIFVENLIFEFIETEYIKNKTTYTNDFMTEVISSYILCADDVDTQTKKYESVMVPIMKRSFDLWGEMKEETYYIRKNFNDILSRLHIDLRDYVVKKNKITPVKLYSDIQNEIEKLPIEENYLMLRKWKLTVEMTNIMAKLMMEPIKLDVVALDVLAVDEDNESSTEKNNWDMFCSKAASQFGEKCLNILKNDVETYFPCIYILFARVLNNINAWFDRNTELEICKSLLTDPNCIQSFLTVIKLLIPYHDYDDDKEKIKELHDLVLAHPTVEVKMHYYHLFKQDGTRAR